jgi:hypothetical protein
MATATALPFEPPIQRVDPAVQALFGKLQADGRALLAAGADRARGPQSEPDRSVWRILSCARAGGVELTDERIRAALPASSLEEIAAARARVAGAIQDTAAEPEPTTLEELLAQPSITMDEARACGL